MRRVNHETKRHELPSFVGKGKVDVIDRIVRREPQ